MRKEKLPPLELEEDELVNAENLSMNFSLHERKYDTLKERLVALLHFKRNPIQKINVLEGISFKIKKGESLGVIGHNGAGKSTLLRIVAGIYKPSEGRIKTKGRIVLLNLGAGFDPEGSGEENVYHPWPPSRIYTQHPQWPRYQSVQAGYSGCSPRHTYSEERSASSAGCPV